MITNMDVTYSLAGYLTIDENKTTNIFLQRSKSKIDLIDKIDQMVERILNDGSEAFDSDKLTSWTDDNENYYVGPTENEFPYIRFTICELP